MLVNLRNSKNVRRLVTMRVPMPGWGPVWWMGARPHNGPNLCPLDRVTAGCTMGHSTTDDNNETPTTNLVQTTTHNMDMALGMDHGQIGVDTKKHLVVVVAATTLLVTTLALATSMTT